MIVTKKKYFMEKKLVKKCVLIAERIEGKSHGDFSLVMGGKEGSGKSTLAVQICGVVASLTGRKFKVDNIFFNLGGLIEDAKQSFKKIYLLDESHLGSMATDWQSKGNKDLVKLLMTCRKKGHFFLFVSPYPMRLNRYVLDRASGLLHTYLRGGKQHGHFIYLNNDQKELAIEHYRKTKQPNYKKHKTFSGTFTSAFGTLIDEEAYEAKKDQAIESIGKVEENKKESETMQRLLQLQYAIAMLPYHPTMESLEVTAMAKALNFSKQSIYRWQKHKDKHPEAFAEVSNDE